jgi:hypothetical protein
MIWLQECMICEYKGIYEGKPEDENTIRATCLPCGHQGAFTLKEITETEQKKLLKK